MIPRALRLNNHTLAATPIMSSVTADLGSSVAAGTHWYFSLDDITPSDYIYLVSTQGSALSLFQLLHPDIERWTRPLQVSYRALAVPVASTSDTISSVTAGLTILPAVPGPLIPGLPTTTMYRLPVLPHQITGVPGLILLGGTGPTDNEEIATKLLLDITILVSGFYDAPKYYTLFYT